MYVHMIFVICIWAPPQHISLKCFYHSIDVFVITYFFYEEIYPSGFFSQNEEFQNKRRHAYTK